MELPNENPADGLVGPASNKDGLVSEKDLKNRGDGESLSLRNRRIAKAAIVESDITGGTEIENFQTLNSDTTIKGKDHLSNAAAKSFQDELTILHRQLVGLPIVGEDPTLAAQIGLEAAQETINESQSYEAPSLAVIRALSDPFTDEAVQKQQAVNMQFHDDIQQADEKIGFFESMFDFGLEFVPFKAMIDNIQITGDINPFTAAESMANMGRVFRNLPPETQKEAFPIILAEWEKSVPRGRALDIMRNMIDPSMSQEDFQLEFGVLPAAEVALAGVGAAKAVVNTVKKLNPISVAARNGRPDKAGELNAQALFDETEEIADAAGITRTDAYENSLPFDTSDFNPAYAGGIAGDTQRTIARFQQEAKNTLDRLTNEDSAIREGILQDDDRAAAISAFEQRAQQYADDLQDADFIVTNVKKVKSDSRGVEFEITGRNENGQAVESVRYDFSLDQATGWEKPDPGLLPDFLTSPKLKASSTNLSNLVSGALRLDFVEAASATAIKNLIKGITKDVKSNPGIGGKSKKRKVREVDELLIYGDEQKRVFSTAELRAGVNGRAYTEDQIVAYAKARTVFDTLFDLHEEGVRRSMAATDTKLIDMFNIPNSTRRVEGQIADDLANETTNTQEFGRIAASPDDAMSFIGPKSGVNSVYNTVTRQVTKVGDLTAEEIQKLYAQGFQLAKLNDTVNFGKGKIFKTVLVKNDQVRPLPNRVLHRNIGYVPRANPRALYFVRQVRDVEVDGRFIPQASTVRAFDTEKQALEFRDNLIFEDKPENKGLRFEVQEDRAMEKAEPGSTGLSAVGGLITRPRKSTEVPFGPEDVDAEAAIGKKLRGDSLEALQLYAQNVNRHFNRNEWRMGAIARWERTAENMFPSIEDTSFDGFDPGNSDNGKFLNDWKNQINEWSGFGDKEDGAWDSLMKIALNAAIDSGRSNNGYGAVTEALHKMKTKSPVAALRSMAFHTLLGTYNPIQLFVQSQGAVITASVLGPTATARLLPRQMGIAALQHIENSPEVLKNVAKGAGWSVDELKQMKQLWDKSGLYDSLLTNADVEAAARGHATTGSAVRKFFDQGLMFYRAGEAFNRRMAFMGAVDEVIEGSNGAVSMAQMLNDDDIFREVLTRASDLMLNLQKSNAASFQKGIASVPTQFMQVTAKTVESILSIPGRSNRVFTTAERAKIFAAQIGMYGMAGVPLAGQGTRYLLETSGISQEQVNDPDNAEVIKFLNGGMYDLMTYLVLNADVEVGKRASLSQGLNDFIVSFTSDSTPLYEAFLGPASVAPSQFWRSISTLGPILISSAGDPDKISMDPDMAIIASQDTKEILFEITGSPFSTWRNATKYRFLDGINAALDRRGNVISRDFNFNEKLLAGLGFELGDVARFRDIAKLNTQRQEFVDDVSSSMVLVWQRFFLALEEHANSGTTMPQEIQNKYRNAITLHLMGAEDMGDRQAILKSYNGKILRAISGDTKLEQQVKRALDNFNSRLVTQSESLIQNNRLTPLTSDLGE